MAGFAAAAAAAAVVGGGADAAVVFGANDEEVEAEVEEEEVGIEEEENHRGLPTRHECPHATPSAINTRERVEWCCEQPSSRMSKTDSKGRPPPALDVKGHE